MLSHSVRFRRLRILVLTAFLFLALCVVALLPGGEPGAHAASGPLHTMAGVSAPGTIAYARDGTELHLVQPDGSNDHVIWTEPAPIGGLTNALLTPAWRPDSAEIAFVSSHEQTTSIYDTDVYGVAPDGSGFRRITNPPDVGQFASFPKATVNVTVANHDLSDSALLVYIAGASQMQEVTVPANSTKTVTFNNVAVFSGKAQFPVVIDGITRWIGYSAAQLTAGGTASVRIDVYASLGKEYLGARSPVWSSDGKELDDDLGQGCIGEAWPASAPAGTTTSSLINAAESFCSMDRGPTPSLANDILYWNYYDSNSDGDGAIYQTTEGGDAGTKVLDTGYASYVYDLKYLLDGSGFLFAEKPDAIDGYSNLYRYDFSTQNWTQLTHFSSGFVNHFSISPDGQYVVFEHTDQDPVGNTDAATDLWMAKIDGTVVAQPFVTDARFPSWSRGTPEMHPTPSPTPPIGPPPSGHNVYLPAIFR